MKLGKGQAEVVRRLAAGDRLMFVNHGRSPSTYTWFSDFRNVSSAVFCSLLAPDKAHPSRPGLVTFTRKPFGNPEDIRLTEKGRQIAATLPRPEEGPRSSVYFADPAKREIRSRRIIREGAKELALDNYEMAIGGKSRLSVDDPRAANRTEVDALEYLVKDLRGRVLAQGEERRAFEERQRQEREEWERGVLWAERELSKRRPKA